MGKDNHDGLLWVGPVVSRAATVGKSAFITKSLIPAVSELLSNFLPFSLWNPVSQPIYGPAIGPYAFL